MPYICKLKVLHLYILAILIVVIHHCVQRNDTEYTPNASRCKRSTWLKKKTQEVITALTNKLSMVMIRMASHPMMATRKQKVKLIHSIRYIQVYSAMAMTLRLNINAQVSRFDTDSGSIGIDNRCSACTSHVPEDFVDTLTDSSKTIKGFAGSKTKGVKVGTLLWKWLDDNGKEHLFKIPDSYHVPVGGVRLLSPQHWAKHQPKSKKGKSVPKGTLSQTKSEEVTLFWNDKRSQLTVPL